MPKEGSSRFMGERNSILFNKVRKKMLENLILATISLEVSALLNVRHCPKLQFRAISRKTNDVNLRNWRKS